MAGQPRRTLIRPGARPAPGHNPVWGNGYHGGAAKAEAISQKMNDGYNDAVDLSEGEKCHRRLRAILAWAVRHTNETFQGGWRANIQSSSLILEAWGEGFTVGSLVIMACVTVVNMRRGVLLHKLILLEVGTNARRKWHSALRGIVLQAPPRHTARYILLHDIPGQRLVSLHHRVAALHILLCPQHCGLDQDQTVRVRLAISLRVPSRLHREPRILVDAGAVVAADFVADGVQLPFL